MAVRSYNAKKVMVLVGGIPMTNVAPDDFCDVEFNEDFVKLQIGADGEGALSVTNNLSGRFTIRLMATSESHDILMGFFTAFQQAKTLVPIMVKDLNGTSLHLGALCWPVKIPKKTYAQQAGTVEWTFETQELVSFVGGNAKF